MPTDSQLKLRQGHPWKVKQSRLSLRAVGARSVVLGGLAFFSLGDSALWGDARNSRLALSVTGLPCCFLTSGNTSVQSPPDAIKNIHIRRRLGPEGTINSPGKLELTLSGWPP